MKAGIIIVCLSVCAVAVLAQHHGFYALDDSEVRPIAEFAVLQLGPEYSLVTIAAKHVQAVQGLLYSLSLLVKKTENGVEEQQVCNVQVHFIPWLGKKVLTRHICRPGTELRTPPRRRQHPRFPRRKQHTGYRSYLGR